MIETILALMDMACGAIKYFPKILGYLLLNGGNFAFNNFNAGDLLFVGVLLFSTPFLFKSTYNVIREMSRLWTVFFVLVAQMLGPACLLFWISPWTDAIRQTTMAKMMDNPITHSMANSAKESLFSRFT